MAFPLIKLFSLVLRVFSKPVLNYVKVVSKNNNETYKHNKSRTFFIQMGHF